MKITKHISLALTLAVAVTSLVYEKPNILNASTIEPIEVDVTGLASNDEGSHSHIWVDKYDDVNMWQQCAVCGEIQNKREHDILVKYTMGETNSSIYNRKITYSTQCGYYKEEPANIPPRLSSEWYYDPMWHATYKIDLNTNEWVLTEEAKDKNGNPIGMDTPIGTEVYRDGDKITTITEKTGIFWGNKLISRDITADDDLKTLNISYKIQVKDDLRLKIKNGRFLGCDQSLPVYYNNDEGVTVGVRNFSLIECKYDVDTGVFTGKFSMSLRDITKKYSHPISVDTGAYLYFEDSDGNKYSIAIGDETVTSDFFYTNFSEPVITSVSVTPSSVTDGWAKEATLNASGTIIGSYTGYYTILDNSGNVIKTKTPFTINDDNSYTISYPLQDMENTDPNKKYTLKIEDYFGKSVTKEFTVPKMDSKAPEITNASNIFLNSGWAKSKTVTLTYKDTGIGQVQTSINNEDNYSPTEQSGDVSTQVYKLVGDIYEPKNIVIYAKDALNNYNYHLFPVNMIDSTSPTVTSFTASNSAYREGTELTVIANDLNATLGKEGSGVKAYYFSSTDSDIVSRNNKLNQWITTNTIPINEPGEYTVKVRDLVGNESPTETLSIQLPNLESIRVGDTTAKSIQPNTTLSNIQSMLSTYATLKTNDGHSQDVELTSWSCPNFDPLVSGNYTFTTEITLPDTMTNTNNISLIVSREVIVLPSSVIKFNYNPLPLSFDFGTSVDDIIASFTEKAVAVESNTHTCECVVKDWKSDDFLQFLQGTYTFTGTIDIPSDKISDPSVLTTVTRQVTIKPPTVGKVEVIPNNPTETISSDGIQRISVPYGTSYGDVLSKVGTAVRVKLNTERYETVQVDKNKLEVSPTYDGNITRTYHGRIAINDALPDYIRKTITDPLYAGYEITVEDKDMPPTENIPDIIGNQIIGNLEDIHKDLPTVHVPYGLEYDSATLLLAKNITVDLGDGVLKAIPVDQKSWKTSYYDGTKPNIYTSKSELELPITITNTKELPLELEQKMIVDPEIQLGALSDKLPILVLPYGTPVKTILDNIPTEVPVKDKFGNVTNYPINADNWNYTYKRGDEPGNYYFTNHISDNIEGNQDVKQIVVIVNRSVEAIEPADKTLPSPTEHPLISKKDTIQGELPKRAKVTLNDGTVFESSLIWQITQDEKQPLVYHYVGTAIMPEYITCTKFLSFDLTYKKPSSKPTAPSSSSSSNSSSSSTSSSTSKTSSTVIKPSPSPTVTPSPTPTPTASPNSSSSNSTTYDFTAFSTSWAKDDVIQSEKLGAPANLADGRMYVPIRHVAYALGLNGKQVVWDSKAHQVAITSNTGVTAILTPGSNIVLVNGESVTIDGAPYIDRKHDDRVMLSLSQVAKLILPHDTYTIDWIQSEKTMRITIKS